MYQRVQPGYWSAIDRLFLFRGLALFPIGFWQVSLPKLPQVFVNLLEIVFLQPIEGAEGQQGIVEPLVILKVAPTEVGEMILLHKAIEDLVNVAVINGERQRVVVAAILGGERVEVLFSILDGYFLDGPNQGKVPGLEPLVNIQCKNVLCHREGGIDVGGVKVV